MENQIIPAPEITPQPISAPPTAKPLKKSYLPLILAVIVILFISIFGGIVLGKFLYGPQTVTPIPTLAPKPIIIPTAIPTVYTEATQSANWKTYINEKYGYSIKYPQETKLEEGSGYEERVQETILTFFGPKYQGPGEWTDGFGITLAVIKNPSQKTPTQFAQEGYKQAGENIKNKILEGDISDCKVETIMKSNIEGARLTHCTQTPGSGILNFSEWYVKNNITYQVYAVLQNGDFRITFDQILSTFKFLDSTPTPPVTYTACGCGCCTGAIPKVECLYKSKGDDLNKIMEADEKTKNSSQCATVGCSIGITYKYCN